MKQTRLPRPLPTLFACIGLLAPAVVPAADTDADALGLTQDLARHARNLAGTCTGCHGGVVGDSPMVSLAGLPAAQIESRMAAFRSAGDTGSTAGAATDAPTVMHQIARGFTQEQVRLIARHFAALPRSPAPPRAAGVQR